MTHTSRAGAMMEALGGVSNFSQQPHNSLFEALAAEADGMDRAQTSEASRAPKAVKLSMGDLVDINTKIKRGVLKNREITADNYEIISKLLAGRAKGSYTLTSREAAIKDNKVEFNSNGTSKRATFMGNYLRVETTPSSSTKSTSTYYAFNESVVEDETASLDERRVPTSDDDWVLLRNGNKMDASQWEILGVRKASKNPPSDSVMTKARADRALRVGAIKKQLKGTKHYDSVMQQLGFNESGTGIGEAAPEGYPYTKLTDKLMGEFFAVMEKHANAGPLANYKGEVASRLAMIVESLSNRNLAMGEFMMGADKILAKAV